MSMISTGIQMYDYMSPVINGMTNAMNICINSFESMQAASGHAVDTTSLQAARQHLAGAEASFMQVENSMRSAGSGQQDFNNRLVQGQGHADGLASKVGNIVKAYVGIQAVKKIFDISDELVQTKARLNMINDGLRTTDQLQEMIFQSAQRSRASYADTANAVAALGLRAKAAFSNNTEAVAFTEVLNKMFTIAGASRGEMSSATLQLTQALGSGVLRGEEFNAVFEAAPNVMQAVADYIGKPIGQLRNMASEGQITADIVKKALFAAANETNDKFNSMPKTIGQIWNDISNQALKAFQPVLLKINEVANNPNVGIMVTNISNGMATIANVTLGVINNIANVGAFFQSNWGIMEPIILGVVMALAIYKGAMLASAIATGVASLAESIYAVGAYNACASLAATEMAIMGKVSAQTIEALVTAEATAAQWGLNAALLSCPIFWIVTAIIALIVIFYVAIAAMNKFAGTSLSATGLIVGAFAMFGGYVFNIFAYVWNITASYVEFFANVFTNPIYSAKRLFVNLASNVLDMCISMTSGFDNFATNMANSIIDGVNAAVKGLNWFIEKCNEVLKTDLGTFGTIEHTASITSSMQGMKGSLNDWLGDTPSNYWTAPKMQMQSLGSAFDWGYGKGASAEKWASNLFTIPETPAATDAGINYDDLLKNAKDTADNTGKIKDKDLTISEEDLKYLRDIAERDSINRFTTAEVKLEMVNHNSISNDMDLDGVIDYLGSGLSEGLQTVAEGATYSV